MDDKEKLTNLENEVEELKGIIAAVASIIPLDLTDDVSIKLNEILDKFKIK